MVTEREALTTGFEFHRAGNFAQAEQIYREVLDANPASSDALYLLGILASQIGRDELAVDWLRRAAALAPKNLEILLNLGRSHVNLNQLDQAKQSYLTALTMAPDNVETHSNLARVLCLQKDFQGALESYARAAELTPNSPEVLNNLGATFQQLGQFEAAKAAYERAVSLDAGNAVYLNNLGLVSMQLGQPELAVQRFQQALEVDSSTAESYFNLANAYQSLFRLEAAVDAYRRAIELRPNYAEAYNNLATALHEMGLIEQAIGAYQQSIALRPALAVTHKNLGNAFREIDQHEQAAEAYQTALRWKPDYSEAALGLLQERQQLCIWDGQNALATQVIAAIDHNRENSDDDWITPFSFITLPVPTSSAQQHRCAVNWSRNRYRSRPAEPALAASAGHRNTRSEITVGYLSSDFHQHATAWLIAELIEMHDRKRFKIVGYSLGPDDQSGIRRRLSTAFDQFRDLRGRSFRESADQIVADEVDILVDLKGHTRYARTEILACRPAPIQVNFLGYPGTMGADFIDYILVDDFVVPSDRQPYYSESLVHLPGCYQVNDGRQETSPETPSRIECGLPVSGFVFCSFNNSYKITDAIFDIWMRLLQSTPGSVLWLLETNRWATVNLRREAQARSIDAARLIFAPRQPNAKHLARQRLADLFLDSYPVNAHTTASDALRMGLPIVTLSGETFISRVAGSLLRVLGLSELITNSYKEYEATAMRLAHQPEELLRVRRRLSENLLRSTLYDGRDFSRKVEKAYQMMWKLYKNGEPPQPMVVPTGLI